MRKPTRTISGITPVAVMLPPRPCEHGLCTYCPQLDVPQSYTPKSPVVMRASQVKYDAYEQVKARLKAFVAMGHPIEKVELIIMGGTFLQYPRKFQDKFVKGCYDALNGRKSKKLGEAKKRNERAKHRCVALCIETRPDWCVEYIERMREWGATRVELGVQIIDDKIYEKVNRGHGVEDVVKATKALRDAGFKIGYHLMPGLPGSNPRKDLRLFKKLFSDSKFKPDQVKLYPCQVMPHSVLEKDYWKGEYKPYNKKQTEKILMQMLKAVPRYCRVMRVMREIPPEYIVSGVINIDLRKDIEEELRKNEVRRSAYPKARNSGVKEIRYREIGFALRDGRDVNRDLKLKITKYEASGGEEHFLEVVNGEDILFGLLRLRIVAPLGVPPKSKLGGREAIIRELHVYGRSLELGERGRGATQHKGMGKKLMKEAEKIAKMKKCDKISVISGVGVRNYYKKMGYVLEKEYMVKRLIIKN
jgi:elongator complex protein 3